MVFCGSALLAVFFGSLSAGEDAGSLSCDKKTLSSFILFRQLQAGRDLAGVAALDQADASTMLCKS